MPTVEASVSIRCDIEEIFDFLSHTESIEKIVPADLKLRLVQAPQRIELGSRYEIQILAFGAPQSAVYEVTEFVRPSRFVEAQVKGPLARYIHEHSLTLEGDRHVRVLDRIEFEPPSGFLGFLLSAETLRKSLAEGLAHRHRELKKRMEG